MQDKAGNTVLLRGWPRCMARRSRFYNDIFLFCRVVGLVLSKYIAYCLLYAAGGSCFTPLYPLFWEFPEFQFSNLMFGEIRELPAKGDFIGVIWNYELRETYRQIHSVPAGTA